MTSQHHRPCLWTRRPRLLPRAGYSSTTGATASSTRTPHPAAVWGAWSRPRESAALRFGRPTERSHRLDANRHLGPTACRRARKRSVASMPSVVRSKPTAPGSPSRFGASVPRDALLALWTAADAVAEAADEAGSTVAPVEALGEHMSLSREEREIEAPRNRPGAITE